MIRRWKDRSRSRNWRVRARRRRICWWLISGSRHRLMIMSRVMFWIMAIIDCKWHQERCSHDYLTPSTQRSSMPAHRAFHQKWRNFQRRVHSCRKRLPTGTSFNHPEYRLQRTGRMHVSHRSRRRLLSLKSLFKRSGSVRGNDQTIFFSRRKRRRREDRMEWWGKILQKATRPEQKHKCDLRECKTSEWKINSSKIKKRRRWFASKKMTNKE